MDKLFAAWKKAQELELDWQSENKWRADDWSFIPDTVGLFMALDLGRDDFTSVIDLGAGPRLRTRYFNAHIFAIEPLAVEYKYLSFCDLWKFADVYPWPAEMIIGGLKADCVISINVLDHCQDFERVIENIAGYSDLAILSFDLCEKDEMHPLELTEHYCEKIFKKHGWLVEWKRFTPAYRGDGQAVSYRLIQ